jgi:hypothetical protein
VSVERIDSRKDVAAESITAFSAPAEIIPAVHAFLELADPG